jgi:hypothetical protein
MGGLRVAHFFSGPRPQRFTGPPNHPIFRPRSRESDMRAETQTIADEIKQSLALLRRHL